MSTQCVREGVQCVVLPWKHYPIGYPCYPWKPTRTRSPKKTLPDSALVVTFGLVSFQSFELSECVNLYEVVKQKPSAGKHSMSGCNDAPRPLDLCPIP